MDKKAFSTASSYSNNNNNSNNNNSNNNKNITSNQAANFSLTVDQLDIEILPIIYDIIRW